MADNWRVLDFTDFEGSLGFEKNRGMILIVYAETGEVIEQHIRDVNIVFVGIRVRVEPATIYHLSKNDVVVLFCDWKGMPVSGMYPWINPHSRVAARQRAQASLSVPRTKNAWMRIVKSKVKGQAAVLRLTGRKGADRLLDMAGSVRSGDPANIEAQAAKAYWRFLFGADFRRIPGDMDDDRNVLLNYGYTILRGHSVRAVLSAGLTPALGVCHCNRSNAFALADDLIEPFRPVIDREVFRLLQTGFDSRSARHSLLCAANVSFSSEGTTVPTVMKSFAQQYGRYVEGDEAILDVPVWGG